MRLQVKALNDTIDDSVKAYVEKRIGRLGKRLYDRTLIEVTLWREKNPSIREDHSAEAIVYTKGPNLVARESALTYEAAIDLLTEKLERQIERYRDKRVHEPRRDAQKRALSAPTPVEDLDLDAGSGKPDEAAA
jgi:putative sigma-54 modulation protein